MPVSVAVCEATNVVNAALRESLNVGSGCVAAAVAATADEAKTGDIDSVDHLQSQIVANAKRVMLSKIEYEEVENYNDSILQNLKSKYIVIKPNYNNNNNNSSMTTNSSGNNSNSNSSSVVHKNGTSGGKTTNGHDNNVNGVNRSVNSTGAKHHQGAVQEQHQQQQHNPNELPKPKRVLYPREQIRIGWKQSDRKWLVGTGLLNVGNTCYLNSTLQALFHIPALANWLISETSHVDHCTISESGGCCIICAMVKTLIATQTSPSAVRPFHIYTKLKFICKHMVVGRQEDAHEFLRFLVDSMEKAYLMRFRNYKELDQLVKETTPLNQIFGGYLRSAVRCLSCSHVSITFQHFQDLLLDIRKADTLEEAFDGYFARERLEDMGYKCEGCKKKVSATKQFSLERAPITLCIQLKRFSMIGNKLTKQITFKPRIDLSKYAAHSPSAAAQPLTYRLVSVVTHLGVSQHCGHYTALGLTESGSYYNFDDSYVRPVAMQSICSTNAYIMFYELDVVSSNPKMNGVRLSNGHGMSTPPTVTAAATATVSHNSQPSPTRFIGPQLPPGGLNGFTASSPATPITNGHQKIAIHFKSGNLPKASSPQKQQQNGNGHHATMGKLQSAGHTKSSTLVGPALQKSDAAATENGNKSSCFTTTSTTTSTTTTTSSNHKANLPISSDDDDNKDDDDDVPGKINAKPQLPSMPKLFGCSPSTPTTAILKSLVPYESASEDDDQQPIVEINPRKRRSTADSDSVSSTEESASCMKNGHRTQPTVLLSSSPPSIATINNNSNNNSSKQKTDAIDEIFKSLNNYNNKHHDSDDDDEEDEDEDGTTVTPVKAKVTTASNGWQRSHKPTTKTQHQQQAQNGCSNSSSSSSSSGSRSAPSSPPKTPPSPAVVKTKTGLWQVSRTDESEAKPKLNSEVSTSISHKNPFAVKSPADGNHVAAKRQKLLNGNPKASSPTHKQPPQHRPGNGYQFDASSTTAVSELLRQSHRGYGSNVLTWNGKQTELENEVSAEAREQRQRDNEDDDENEMDRGRQRKVKTTATSLAKMNATPGYNPFQELENQKRWHKSTSNGNGGSYTRFNNHHNYRHNFQQRNKFKFNRFGGGGGGSGSNKYQQQRALQRHLASGGGFTRRQQQS